MELRVAIRVTKALLAAGVALSILVSYRVEFEGLYLRYAGSRPRVEQAEVRPKVSRIEMVTQSAGVSTPAPLRARVESPVSALTVDGVVKFTNFFRSYYNLPQLTVNDQLNRSAALKARDMLNRQYFAHDSPDGRGAGDLAKDVGYEYLAVGENLALGNFADDQVLVQAWMDSPGHRENILSAKYSEIGVAVIRGTYEGKNTWMAVQHFGRPRSACGYPDQNLKSQIDANNAQLNQWSSELESLKGSVSVDEFNARVEQFNTLVSATKILVEQYNDQVNDFNACAAQ